MFLKVLAVAGQSAQADRKSHCSPQEMVNEYGGRGDLASRFGRWSALRGAESLAAAGRAVYDETGDS